MSITDRTRKLLWGRSGNRCAICKNELVVDSTQFDRESIVGEECHIVSSRLKGPRFDSRFPATAIDTYENLVLLCRTHHKQIDDQSETFSVDILKKIKSDHEAWVSEKLANEGISDPLRVRRIAENIPQYLEKFTTGKQLLELVTNVMAYSFDHDELHSEQEAELVGCFLQNLQDWGEISRELDAGERVHAAYSLSHMLSELEQNGFIAFGGREVRMLEGGAQEEPSSWPIAILCVLRIDNNQIIQVTMEDAEVMINQTSNKKKHD